MHSVGNFYKYKMVALHLNQLRIIMTVCTSGYFSLMKYLQWKFIDFRSHAVDAVNERSIIHLPSTGTNGAPTSAMKVSCVPICEILTN